jgi:dolichol-phosphate mannosyltransferase
MDDGSTDGTCEVLACRRDLQIIRHPRNMGYGQSLIDAFALADAQRYDWVVTMDCDEQHEPEAIPEFIRAIESDRWDIVSGSRYLRSQQDNDLPPQDRRSINATITQHVNDLFGLKLTDSFCGFKAHRVSAMRKLRLDEAGYAFPMQLWPRAAHAGLRVTEVPIRLIYNDPTRHFGGKLDDADFRLKHYMSVLQRELDRMTPKPASSELAPCCDCA